jgi:hypothetical protein
MFKAISLSAVLLLPPLAAQQPTKALEPVLAVQTAGGQTTFHIGERIPLELRFTSANAGRYRATNAHYDRSGRMHYESFTVQPDSGWADPLSAYFSSGAFFGGGLFNYETLSDKPMLVPLDLNEWVRFDQPGTYEVTVTSSRVEQYPRAKDAHEIETHSNPLVLHIIDATPEWQKAKFVTALSQLNAHPLTNIGSEDPEAVSAMADLRFLDSKASSEYLAAHLTDDDRLRFASAFGLMGASPMMHEAAVAALNRQIEEPNFPVSDFFLTTLATLQKTPPSSDDAARFSLEGKADGPVWRSVLAALPRKQGAARAATAHTLTARTPRDVLPEERAQLAQALTASFLDLSNDDKLDALEYRWDTLRPEAMLPILQQVAAQPADSKSYIFPGRWHSTLEVKASALKRWYELDPSGAIQQITIELSLPDTKLTAENLAFLPEKQTFPQYEPIWAQVMANSKDREDQARLAGLLTRFGTGSAAAQVSATADKNLEGWPCALQAPALAYLVKFDAAMARPFLDRTLAARGQDDYGCFSALIRDVGRLAHGKALNEVALASINDRNPDVVTTAAEYLRDHGDESAAKPLLERYLIWAEQWHGKDEELDHPSEKTSNTSYQGWVLGRSLGEAIISPHGWMVEPSIVAHVAGLCVGEQVCNVLRKMSIQAKPPYPVSFSHFAGLDYLNLAQYTEHTQERFIEKLRQFPAGTHFMLEREKVSDLANTSLEQNAEAIFRQAGLVLEEQSAAALSKK